MRITYRWMKEYLNFAISPREMIDKLTEIGHEVEEIIDLGLLENPIRVCRITRVEPHPDAKNLTLCTVEDGSGEPLTVVCGAPNVAEGATAVLARVGAKLPNGVVLKKTKIRGVYSEGMLLASDEMGLGSDHSGLLLLEKDALPIGEGYDVIIDLSITPNRPDCLSIFGLARDIAAAYGQKVYPRPGRSRETYVTIDSQVKISVKCTEDCPRYTARLIRGIKIAPSPQWLQLRLLSVGLRPINNVVDVTNYILMERGHPLHAFDFDHLRGQQIIVRLAKHGETLELLDGTNLTLKEEEDMVIADGERPVALAGIMGGATSEITETTENILLESAYFSPTTIRRSSKRHHISTDASFRFERGTEQGVLIEVLDRATSLIAELGHGEVAKGIIDTTPKQPALRSVLLRTDRARRMLGIEITKTQIADILASLGFEIVRSDRENLVVSVPGYRVDISREEDIYEEIARIHGYAKIPATIPYLPATASRIAPINGLQRFVQNRLVGLGFSEIITFSFMSPDHLEELGMDASGALQILNPLSRDQAILRTDLAPQMLRTMLYNQNHGNSALRLFELGKAFGPGDDMVTPYHESETLSLGMMGATESLNFRAASREVDFFDLKGCLETLFISLGLPALKWVGGAPPLLHPGRSARIFAGDTEVGWAGELNPAFQGKLGFKNRPQLAQIHLDLILPLVRFDRVYVEIPRYPATERDLALVVDQGIAACQIEEIIRSMAGELLESLYLFDFYIGAQVQPGKKSLAYRLTYRSAARTLTDVEVDDLQKKVLGKLASDLGAVLR